MTKNYFEAFFVGVYGLDVNSERSEETSFLADFVMELMEIDIYSGTAPILHETGMVG